MALAFSFVCLAIINTYNAYKSYNESPADKKKERKKESIIYVILIWILALIAAVINLRL